MSTPFPVFFLSVISLLWCHHVLAAAVWHLQFSRQSSTDNDNACPVISTRMYDFNAQQFPAAVPDAYPIWYFAASYPPLPNVGNISCLNIAVQYGDFGVDTAQEGYNFTQGSIVAGKQHLQWGFFLMATGNESHWEYQNSPIYTTEPPLATMDVLFTDYTRFAVMTSCNLTPGEQVPQRAWVLSRSTDGLDENLLEFAQLILRSNGFPIDDTNFVSIDNTGCRNWKHE